MVNADRPPRFMYIVKHTPKHPSRAGGEDEHERSSNSVSRALRLFSHSPGGIHVAHSRDHGSRAAHSPQPTGGPRHTRKSAGRRRPSPPTAEAPGRSEVSMLSSATSVPGRVSSGSPPQHGGTPPLHPHVFPWPRWEGPPCGHCSFVPSSRKSPLLPTSSLG